MKKRLFTGIPLPVQTVKVLVAHQDKLKESVRARWVPGDNLHLTLVFLGSVDESAIPSIAAALEHAVAGLPAFQAKTAATGSFSKRVLWTGVEPKAPLTQIHDAIRQALAVSAERFVPHITLARDFRTEGPLPDAVTTEFTVDSFCLFESIQTPKGVRYAVLQKFPLGGAPCTP